MKISSASKKVLASALSAAMVVAFAPTVAFGAIDNGTKVTISFDANGGTLTDSHESSIATVEATVANGKLTFSTPAADIAKKGDYQVAGWFFDGDNDGKYTAGANTKDVLLNAGASNAELTVSSDAFSGDAVTLKAYYAEPAVDTATLTAAVDTGAISAASVKAKNLINGKQYYATVTLPSGDVVTTDVATASSAELTFDAIGKMTAAQKTIAAGTYAYKVYKVGAADPIATKDVKAVTVTLSAGAGYGSYTTAQKTSYVVVEGTTYGAVAGTLNAVEPNTDAGYTFKGYEDANGVKLAASDSANKIKADTTFSAIYSNPRVTTSWVNTVTKTLTFKFNVDDIAKTVGVDEAAKIGSYDATITGPNGFSKIVKGVSPSTDETLTFGAEWEAAAAVKDQLAAGTYTVSIAPVAAAGKTLAASTASAIATKTVELTTVTYDLDGGSWKSDKASQDAVKGAVALWQVGLEFNVTKLLDGATCVNAPSKLQSFKEWQIGGKAAANTAVTSAGIVAKAVYQTTKAEAPAVAVAASGTKFVLTVTPAAGTKVKYAYGSSAQTPAKDLPADGKVTVDAAAAGDTYVSFQAVDAKDSTKVSDVVTYVSTKADAAQFETQANAVMTATTSASTANAPVRYGDTLKTLASDGKAVIAALGYVDREAVPAASDAQYKDALNKVAEIEKANVAAKKALAKQAGGSYKYIADSDYDKAVAAIDAVITKWDTNHDVKDGAYDASNDKTVDGVATGAATLLNYVNEIKAAAAGVVMTTAKAADVEAAQAVDAKVAKLAADYAEVTKDNYQAAIDAAIDAQTDYAALTATQKAFVSADAQETIAKVLSDAAVVAQEVKDEEAKKAAEEAAKKLADAQDQAAANLLYSKTVTAKAKVGKKAQGKSFTYKLGASESGATATYAKASGSKYIKVSASGKVTFSKVKAAKKAKTYKAKVTVTYGTQTATKTVTYKVVKK